MHLNMKPVMFVFAILNILLLYGLIFTFKRSNKTSKLFLFALAVIVIAILILIIGYFVRVFLFPFPPL
jgi:hypothetical protein